MAYKIFRPRRGKKSYMDSSGTILAKGEMFFEVPESGVGTGNCKVKMGDGVSDYATLPYAIDAEAIDVSTSEITFSESTSTTNSVLLGEIVSGATVASLFGSIKKLLSNLSDSVTELNNDSANYITSGALSDGSVTKLGTSTVGSGTKPIYWNAGVPAASSSTVGSATEPVYLNSGTVTKSDVSGYWVFDNDTSIETQMQNMTANRAYMGFIDAYSKSNANTKCPSSGYYFTLCWSRADYNRVLAFHVNSQNMFTKNYQSSSGWTDWAAIMRTESQTAVGNSTTPIYATANGVATACSAMMPLTGSTFTGVAYAQTNTSYTTYQLRNIAFTTSTPSSLTNGYICMVYS